MQLDRNANPDGRQKYALLNLRRTDLSLEEIRERVNTALGGQVLQFGDNDETEFFVIKLKDRYAASALAAYATSAALDGETEYAEQVLALSRKARAHPLSKKPD